jgi:hypothetical protein
MNESELREFEPSCDKDYCFLRAIIALDAKYSKRLIMQMKMIEVYKYQMETAMKKEIGWSESLAIWVESGMAKKFAAVFEEGVSVRDMKKRMFNE